MVSQAHSVKDYRTLPPPEASWGLGAPSLTCRTAPGRALLSRCPGQRASPQALSRPSCADPTVGAGLGHGANAQPVEAVRSGWRPALVMASRLRAEPRRPGNATGSTATRLSSIERERVGGVWGRAPAAAQSRHAHLGAPVPCRRSPPERRT